MGQRVSMLAASMANVISQENVFSDEEQVNKSSEMEQASKAFTLGEEP